MRKAIFTVNLGGYDHQPKPPLNNPDWDKILFTDEAINPEVKRRWTRVVKVDPTDRPDIVSRDIKWRSHIHLPNYDLVVYHDANFQIQRKIEPIPFRVKHALRTTVKEEADALNAQEHRWTVDQVNAQMEYLEEQGFPDDEGMWYGGFFCREHSEEDNRLCEDVFDMVKTFTSRDQLAFPYAMWKNNYKISNPVDYEFMKYHARRTPHKKEHPVLGDMTPRVHHITPARSDKNYGKAINDLIKGLPDNHWICLRDIDTLPLDHVSFIKQCEEIAKAGEYGLVSCMTNRLGLKRQLIYGEMLDPLSTDIGEEIDQAKKISREHGSTVTNVGCEVAGLMMLFPKRVWKEVGGFKEGGIVFGSKMLDNIFYNDVKKKKYKVGIAKGIYLFHLYRWGKNRTDKTHLK